jgi:hypothetical protein
MELSDGFLIYPRVTPAVFVSTVSLTWSAQTSVGVICDDQEGAITELGNSIVAINALAGREARIYDAFIGTRTYLRTGVDHVEQYNDRIYEHRYRDHFESLGFERDVATNTDDLLNFNLIKKESIAEDFIAVEFNKLSNEIKSINKNADEIVLDYTISGFTNSNNRHISMARELTKYYIYNQEDGFIYDFSNRLSATK